MNERLATAYGDWLGTLPWDCWCTFTFKDERSEASATRAFLRFGAWLQQEQPGAGWFFAHEVGQLGRLHIHALLGGLLPQTSRRALWAWWKARHGRARIEPYDPDLGAAHYIVKYVTKGFLYYDIEPPRPGCQLDVLARNE